MDTQTLEKPNTTDNGDDLDHIFCCDVKRALCGADLSNSEYVTDFDELDLLCVVCDYLSERPCESCGYVSNDV